MLQPASRHSKPAALKILSSPSASACFLTQLRAGHHHGPDAVGHRRPLHDPGRGPQILRRALVHEPMNTRSSRMSWIGVPGSSPMYSRASTAALRSLGSENESGSGTTPVTGATWPGLVPQLTMRRQVDGVESPPGVSNCAPGSVRSCSHSATARSKSLPFGA